MYGDFWSGIYEFFFGSE